MTMVFVTYAGEAATRFDRDYYVVKHLPLDGAWGPYGLESTAAFFPAGDGAGTIAGAVCVFQDEPSIAAALGSPQTGPVMADIKQFTDAVPSQSRAARL